MTTSTLALTYITQVPVYAWIVLGIVILMMFIGARIIELIERRTNKNGIQTFKETEKRGNP